MSKPDLEYRSFINKNECLCSSRPCHYPPCPSYPGRCICPTGADGKSAYQIAVDNGFVGTEAEWLESLKGDPGEAGPFLSCYLEASGSTQRITTDGNVVFDVDPDALDIAGTGIALDASGMNFTITRAGLYHIEWSLNLTEDTVTPAVFGLFEDGYPASALANIQSSGAYSSGGLINVTAADLPYVISLRNFGGDAAVSDTDAFENVAASIRILRFADGEN